MQTPRRGDELNAFELRHVVYCIGLTSDFRTKQKETVEAHVSLLARLLDHARPESLVYLSSTRLYAPGELAREDGMISAYPDDPSYTYNLSKALGEALTLNGPHRGLVIRLSNVFGVDPGSLNFLPSVIEDALRGEAVLRTSLESSKDYVAVEDAVDAVVSSSNKRRRASSTWRGGGP